MTDKGAPLAGSTAACTPLCSAMRLFVGCNGRVQSADFEAALPCLRQVCRVSDIGQKQLLQDHGCTSPVTICSAPSY